MAIEIHFGKSTRSCGEVTENVNSEQRLSLSEIPVKKRSKVEKTRLDYAGQQIIEPALASIAEAVLSVQVFRSALGMEKLMDKQSTHKNVPNGMKKYLQVKVKRQGLGITPFQHLVAEPRSLPTASFPIWTTLFFTDR